MTAVEKTKISQIVQQTVTEIPLDGRLQDQVDNFIRKLKHTYGFGFLVKFIYMIFSLLFYGLVIDMDRLQEQKTQRNYLKLLFRYQNGAPPGLIFLTLSRDGNCHINRIVSGILLD